MSSEQWTDLGCDFAVFVSSGLHQQEIVRMQGTLKVQSFRDLQVWQRSMEMTLLIYRLTQSFPREEQYGIINQLRRAAVSIPANISEGQGRLNTREFIQFLGIARGSNCEVQTLLEVARGLGFGDTATLKQTHALSHEIGKMLFSLIATLRHNIK